MTRARAALPGGDIAWGAVHGDRFAPDDTAAELPLDDVTLLAPATPGKVVCVGRNYAAHAKELGNTVPSRPKLFMKPATSVVGPGVAIERPVHMSELVHHEGELAVVIGAPLRRASESAAMAAVAGYTCANDVTARDVQRADGAFTRGKGFDTFCPLGPVLAPPDTVDWSALTLEVRVNGEVRQRAPTREMVFPVPALLAYISQIMTLAAGDVVLTGTPEGVGPLLAGDEVTVDIAGIGALRNPVVDAPGGHDPYADARR